MPAYTEPSRGHIQQTATMSWTKPCWQGHCGQRSGRKRGGSRPQARVPSAQQECQRMKSTCSSDAVPGRKPETPLSPTYCYWPRACD